MILGLGTDLIEISRIEHSLTRFGDRFLQRIYTPLEIAYCQAKRSGMAQSLAARFAAKEAGAKALGTGIARGILWSEIEVRNLPGGRPTLLLHGRAALRAQQLGVRSTTLSLSHSRDLAIAVVVAEGLPGTEQAVPPAWSPTSDPAPPEKPHPTPTRIHPRTSTR